MATTYTVQEGDNLSSIAMNFYGDPNQWTVIYEANKGVIGTDPNALHVGTVLIIPDPAAPPTPTPTPPANGQTTYVTVPGDTLSGIAQRVYGNANLWPVIYEANKAVIGPDPNVLYVGTTLVIPPPPAPPTTPPTTPPGNQTTYVTVPGDTLWGLAERFYGDGTKWPTIYNANQQVIGPDPNVLQPGLTLTIPPA